MHFWTLYWLSSLPPLEKEKKKDVFCRTLPLNLFCCQYLLRCQMIRLNRSKESQYIFGVAEFVVAPNLLLPNLLFVDNVGILCYVSPICQSLRSAPREANMPDSTNNLGSNVVQVLQVRHQIPHLLRYVKNII